MANLNLNAQFSQSAVGIKQINYLSRDYETIRTDLINYLKAFFPDQWQDFNVASPGMALLELNAYVDFTGWTNGYFPTIITQTVPQTSGGFDSFGNSILSYNFLTTEVPLGTSSGAWYTWIIPVNATNNLKQTQIDYSTSSPTILTTVNMESTIYNYTFTYLGTTSPQGTYRVYTTYPGTNFRLLNSTSIYFRGNTVA